MAANEACSAVSFCTLNCLLYWQTPTCMKTGKTILLLLILFLTKQSYAGEFRPAAIIPGVHCGYIFNAGISFGAELNYAPFVFKSGIGKTATGLYGSLNYFYSKGEMYKATWYHTFSAGAMAFSDKQFLFKAGACKSVLRWGRKNMNKTKSKNINPDLDFSYSPLKNGAFIGYRIYFPGNACFGLDINTAHCIYAAYRFNFDRHLFDESAE